LKLLLDDGDEQVSSDGAPLLRLHGVLASTKEMLDAQALLDLPEEGRFLPWTLRMT
jgi:hypothetical protein